MQWRQHLRRLNFVFCVLLLPRSGPFQSAERISVCHRIKVAKLSHLIRPLVVRLVLDQYLRLETRINTSIFLSSVHLASSEGRGAMLRILGECILPLVTKCLAGLSDEVERLRRRRAPFTAFCMDVVQRVKPKIETQVFG